MAASTSAKFLRAVAALCLLAAPLSSEAESSTESSHAKNCTVSNSYCRTIAAKVDDLVRADFFDQGLVNSAWAPAYQSLKSELADKKTQQLTLAAFGQKMNGALSALKTSHCQFVTQNDEAFYFLHSLFGSLNKSNRTRPHAWARPIACTGMATGGCGFEINQVRYVLDGSPADKAGLTIGDKILTVAGKPYSGYLDFLGQEGKPLKLSISSQGKTQETTLTPVKKDLYSLYVDATRASYRKITRGKSVFGYVHLWAGGPLGAEAVNEVIADEFRDVDGLIYDLRDGYGGASMQDLDIFFRPAAAFPDCISTDKAHKITIERQFFDKPMVVLINSGSRSGKELLAYGLKNSGRALLVGENTAGYVVAGRLTPIDNKCALYLAVIDISLKDKQLKRLMRLEGMGVAPDIVQINTTHDQLGYGTQLSTAIEALEKRLASQN